MNRSAPGRVIIVGAGGHGRVVADLVRACGHELVGFAELDDSRVGQQVEPGGACVVVGQSKLLQTVDAGAPLPANADYLVVAVGDNQARCALGEQLKNHLLGPLVHPSAVVSPSATLGAGTVVLPRVVINAAAVVGAHVIVNSGAIIEHDCTVAAGCHLSPGMVLSGTCSLGERVWMGSGSCTVHGITIGADTVVGAGTVVISDLPAGVTAVGNPARVLGGK